jgi:hypothetical protein
MTTAPKTWFVTGAPAASAPPSPGRPRRRRPRRRHRPQPRRPGRRPSAPTATASCPCPRRHPPEQIAAAVEAALARFGRIDVLVNNAGYGHLGLFEETTPPTPAPSTTPMSSA